MLHLFNIGFLVFLQTNLNHILTIPVKPLFGECWHYFSSNIGKHFNDKFPGIKDPLIISHSLNSNQMIQAMSPSKPTRIGHVYFIINAKKITLTCWLIENTGGGRRVVVGVCETVVGVWVSFPQLLPKIWRRLLHTTSPCVNVNNLSLWTAVQCLLIIYDSEFLQHHEYRNNNNNSWNSNT